MIPVVYRVNRTRLWHTQSDKGATTYATMSAALKLLRRRRIARGPGLPDLPAGTTTAAALFVIQEPGAVDPAALRGGTATGVSCTEAVEL